MKIAILSLVPGHNYGGILQSYALRKVLEKMGHDVSVISHKRSVPPYFSFRKIPHYIVRTLRKVLKGSRNPIFAEHYNANRYKTIQSKTTEFCKKYLNLKEINTFSDINKDEFDAYVVGSDQVWRPIYFEGQHKTCVENAYLSFAKDWDVRRIAYAPSFGVDDWEYSPEQTLNCTELLSKFDALSVREQSGITMCKEKLCREDAILLCDPTMLLTKEDYEHLITPNTPPSEGNLLVYCLDKSEELNELVRRISKEKDLTPFSANAKQGAEYTLEELIMPSVESWIRGFRDAEFVITDSFHACVFSLIFHKPFLVFGNAARGMARFETLLETFGQSQRLLFKADDYNNNNNYPSFEHTDEIFSALRSKAFHFLNSAL